MIFDLLLVIGVAVLSAALRTFTHPLLFRLGTLGVLATSFLAGWLLGGNVWLGVGLALSWLFLPWLEILTRIRALHLPIEQKLEPRRPPTRGTFPNFSEMSDEIEAEGFEPLEDIGWDFETTRHFYRVFHSADRHAQASICLSEQQDFAFYYLTITSRTQDGRVFTTWNYPFSYGLHLQPRLKVQRFAAQGPFTAMQASHERFLRAHGVERTDLAEQDAEATVETMQNEMRTQIAHNLEIGLLKRDDQNFIRYTVRGMFFLWFQFLRDFVRLS